MYEHQNRNIILVMQTSSEIELNCRLMKFISKVDIKKYCDISCFKLWEARKIKEVNPKLFILINFLKCCPHETISFVCCHSFTHPAIHLFIHLSIYHVTHPSTNMFIHSLFVHSFIHSFILFAIFAEDGTGQWEHTQAIGHVVPSSLEVELILPQLIILLGRGRCIGK